MTDTVTTHFGWVKPEPHASPLDWGVKLNADLDLIDAKVFALDQGKPAANQIVLNATAVSPGNPIYGQMNGVNRWVVELGDGAPESGGNVGSNFTVNRYADNGSYLDMPFSIVRATGQATFSGVITCASAIVATNTININGSTSAVLGLCDGSGAVKGAAYWQASDNTVILSRSSGAYVKVDASSIYLSHPTTVNGGLSAGGGLGCKSNINISAASGSDNAYAGFSNSAGARQGYCGWIAATNIVTLATDGGTALFLNPDTSFTYNGNGNAFKAGGGSWLATSDARVKTVINDYDGGLADILQLRPVVYRYNGNDGEAHKQVAADHKSFIGLVAQEVEGVMPEMVSYGKGEIDGVEVSDLRTLDTTPLLFALLNAVKELKAEIEELKRR